MTSLLYHHAQLATCISSLLVFVHFINWIVFWLFNFKVLLIYFGPIVYQILSYSLVCSLIADSCSKLKVFLLLIKPCFLLILYIMPLVFKKKKSIITTGDVAQWLEYWPGMYKVLGSILKCQHTHDYLMFVLPSSLSCFSYICLLWRDMWAIVHIWRSEDNLLELVLFPPCVPGIRLGWSDLEESMRFHWTSLWPCVVFYIAVYNPVSVHLYKGC